MREPDVRAGGISRHPRQSKGQSGHEGDNQAEPPSGYPHSRNLIHHPSSREWKQLVNAAGSRKSGGMGHLT